MGIETLIESDKRLAMGIYRMGQSIGKLSELSTSNKGSLVQAINEALSSAGAAGLSEERARELITAELAKISGGASEAFDTLKELEDAISRGSSSVSAILAEIAALKQKDQQIDQALVVSSQLPDIVDNIMLSGRE